MGVPKGCEAQCQKIIFTKVGGHLWPFTLGEAFFSNENIRKYPRIPKIIFTKVGGHLWSFTLGEASFSNENNREYPRTSEAWSRPNGSPEGMRSTMPQNYFYESWRSFMDIHVRRSILLKREYPKISANSEKYFYESWRLFTDIHVRRSILFKREYPKISANSEKYFYESWRSFTDIHVGRSIPCA